MPGTFVSIGNRTESFARLLDGVVRLAPELPQPVVVQHGRTPFASDEIDHFAFTDEPGFQQRLEACELFICHGGGGSVLTAIKKGLRPVVVPRLVRYGENVDDHQLDFTRELAGQGTIVPVYDIAGLLEAAREAVATPLPQRATSQAHEAIARIARAVEAYAPRVDDPILLVTPSGGHLTETHAMAEVYRLHPHHYVINVPVVETPDMRGRTSVIALSERDWKFVVNLGEAFVLLRRHRPKVILTTGGGFSVAFALVGKLLGIPTVYIETVGKVVVPTVTGRVMYHLADRFFYQWRQLDRFFPKGEFVGVII